MVRLVPINRPELAEGYRDSLTTSSATGLLFNKARKPGYRVVLFRDSGTGRIEVTAPDL
ncbi:MAG: hypothetical protein ABSB78_08460 [Bacteroidota bacterium]